MMKTRMRVAFALVLALALALPIAAYAQEAADAPSDALAPAEPVAPMAVGGSDSASDVTANGALTPNAANTFPGEAAGTADDPYLISTEEDLRAFAISVNGMEPKDGTWVSTGTAANDYAGKYVALASDITMSEAAIPIGIGGDGSAGALGLQHYSICFKGTFLGRNHVISNFYCTADSNPAYGSTVMNKHESNTFSALFGGICDATIQDLTVKLASGRTYGEYAGGLVGCVDGGTNFITHCAVIGDVTSSGGKVGGLVACYQANALTIASSYHNGKVTGGGGSVAGLVGYINHAGLTIEGSYQAGEVKSTDAGTTYFPNSYKWGIFVGTVAYSASISKCVSDQEGQMFPGSSSAIHVTASACLTGVTDWTSAGVKAALGEEYFDYSGDSSTPPPFIGSVQAPSRHDVTYVVGKDVSGAVPATTSVEAGSTVTIPAATLTRLGYEFVGWATSDVEGQSEALAAASTFIMPDKAVTLTASWKEKPVTVITTETQLRTLAADVNAGRESPGGCYKLGNDITLTRPFTPIGGYSNAFSGIFDGDGHVVYGLNVTNETAAASTSGAYKYAGLFGCVSGPAIIKNLGVEGSVSVTDATGSGYAGGLVGSASGVAKSGTIAEGLVYVQNCFARVQVEGTSYVGGLVGTMTRGRIWSSYASGSAHCDGNGSTGGLVGNLVLGSSSTLGEDEALVDNSYCAVDVRGYGASVGSLAGRVYVGTTAGASSADWRGIRNSYALQLEYPAYTDDGAKYYGADSRIEREPDQLKEMAATLGSDFKDDLVNPSLQVNGGYPLLKWESTPSISKISIMVAPASAQAKLVDDATGAELAVANTTTVTAGGNTYKAFSYTTNSLHAYTATVSADGYETATCEFPASATAQTETVSLSVIEYGIVFQKSNATWATGYVAPSSYTVESPAINLPTADDLSYEGYRFKGWYAAADYSGGAIGSIPAGSTGNKTFYALFEYMSSDDPGDAGSDEPGGGTGGDDQKPGEADNTGGNANSGGASGGSVPANDGKAPADDEGGDSGDGNGGGSDGDAGDSGNAGDAGGEGDDAGDGGQGGEGTPSAPAAEKAEGVVRLEGAFALDTMAAIVAAGNYAEGGTVVISTIDGYWDALTAAGVAGLADAPVLMTDGTTLSSQTARIIRDLAPSTVVVCGGPAAISDDVLSAATAAAGDARAVRLYGANAVGTAIDIFASAQDVTGGTWRRTAFICTNDGYWDALAAAPLSYALHMPIFLTDGVSSVSDDALAAMEGSIDKAYIVGGELAVSADVQTQLEEAGIQVLGRLWGTTAIGTSEAVATFGLQQGMTADSMGVATSGGYWDALAGAALCGRLNSVLVLAGGAESHSVASGGFVSQHASDIEGLYIFGGTAAVDSSVESLLKSELA